MSLRSFLKSKIFFRQVVIALLITFVLLQLVMLVLKIYTGHGESLTVPDLSGMTKEQARKTLEKSGIRCEVVDSLYVKNARHGTVVGQIPASGAHVKKNRLIYLTICTMAPEQVSMPKLTDIAYRQALNVIENSGLEIGDVIYKPSEYANLVLEQMVFGETAEVGMHVPKGTKVDLVVGQVSSGEQINVPDLIGENYSAVKEIVRDASLNLGAVVFDDSFSSEEDSINAIVWKQRPDPSDNTKIYKGQSVDIWLTVDETTIQKALQNTAK